MSSDRDPGDYDATEVHQAPPDAWHPSHLPAHLPPAPGPTPTGRHYAAQLLETVRTAKTVVKAHRAVLPRSGWVDTPEAFRALVARSAGLPADVVAKKDRELSESEKSAIREAARRLRERADALFAI